MVFIGYLLSIVWIKLSKVFRPTTFTSEHRRIQELKLGAKVERRRRQRVWGVRRGCPLPIRGGVWGSPENFFSNLKVKMAYFRGLCAKFRFFSMTIIV